MTDYASKEDLAPSALPEEDLPLDRGMVRVRGLSRGEVFAMQEAKKSGGLKDLAAWERRMVATGLLIPAMTESEVGDWQRTGTAGGDLEKLTNKISALSGLSDDADKSGVSGVRGGRESGVRVLPGDEAEPDGGPAAGADEQ